MFLTIWADGLPEARATAKPSWCAATGGGREVLVGGAPQVGGAARLTRFSGALASGGHGGDLDSTTEWPGRSRKPLHAYRLQTGEDASAEGRVIALGRRGQRDARSA